ncbi:MAG: acyl-CoA dehydrogenase family protein [Ardenticatenaceae bacterium]|nr:acyl-CoA dehydrogenase family protein [Ardenticatenaceae bacterium]HBY95129.1 acyl-CoA dehydrogenase [Chloroflexota bacterium]
MDLALSEEQVFFQKAMKEFAEKEIAPLVEEAEAKEQFPVELFPKLGALGYLGIRYPAQYGGAGADKVTECIYVEELHRVCSGIAAGLMVGALAADPIFHFGTEEQKQQYLTATIKGEKIAAFALTEPDAGSDVASIRTTATRDQDDYILNGTKMFITNGPICDYCVVAAYTDHARRREGITLFIVDRDAPGFSVSRKLGKVGNRSAETAELVFENCRIPVENRIGTKEGEGFAQLSKSLASGRISFGARCVGVAQAAYEMSLKYAQTRVQFGRPISEFQVNKFKLAEMAMYIDIMRTITYRAACLLDQGVNCSKEASMVKLFCTETLQKITADAMQIHGGYGYMMEFPIQRLWRDARLYTITEGTSEIQHLIIARELGV